MTDRARDELAVLLWANSPTLVASAPYPEVYRLRDAILAAGWLSPAHVRAAQVEALRDAAQWENMPRATVQAFATGADRREIGRYLLDRADAVAPSAEPEPFDNGPQWDGDEGTSFGLPAPSAEEAKPEPCWFVSASSDDGYCACILPKHDGYHRCTHGLLQ